MEKGFDLTKIRKTILIGIFVSLAAQIRFEFVTVGFIIAMSVLVMAIFIYCYEDLSPLYIAICSGIFSPVVRLFIYVFSDGDLNTGIQLVAPDMIFFFTYGIIYVAIYKYILKKPKSIRNFPYVIFTCDVTANILELIIRGLIEGKNHITVEVVTYLIVVALCRVLLIQMILISMEAYSNLLVRQEHDEEYRKLLMQASVFESELHVMEKNATEIESIMKQAYSLYKEMESIDAPQDLKDSSLEISKCAHEIKGDYLGVIGVLKESYLDNFKETHMSIGDIIEIEKFNLLSLMKKKGKNIEINSKVKVDFFVVKYFKMMSIIRNLILNSTEAVDDVGGKIFVVVSQYNDDNYMISVRDNGCGISENDYESVFLDGYSTKFNMETGNIQRGFGLNLVKDYVENFFDGTISVKSSKGEFTQFTIIIPKKVFEEEQNEILHS